MFSTLLSVTGLALALIPAAQAGYNPSATNNIAVYWGQNSVGRVGSQNRLSYYCQNSPSINIIPLSFLTGISNPGMNLANAGDNCTAIAGSGLLSCPQIEADIKECQSTYGKTIMLSIGGATYSEGGFSSSSAAVAAANNVWAWFGPQQGGVRPFGSAVIDGFDFDFESSVQNMEPFAQQLRTLIDAATDKKYYLSAAPQCPYPDQADQSFINGQVAMDWVQVQFYNNYCSVGNYPNGWNYADWDNWAKNVSKNKNAKVLVGIPGAVTGANSGSYASGSQLAQAISASKGYSSFGGIMMWDMSQLYANPGFEAEVVNDLGGGAPSQPNPPPLSPPRPSPLSPRPPDPLPQLAVQEPFPSGANAVVRDTLVLPPASLPTSASSAASGGLRASKSNRHATTTTRQKKTLATISLIGQVFYIWKRYIGDSVPL
ncbi:Endochitinase 33 [Cladobotryum mycophilum]|uniref:chitinase n=1 Tax=Cladobotryum mycophilum TaxID=491253 RepID=A0ABR0T522_9HYPO